jgi:hypothetical protein
MPSIRTENLEMAYQITLLFTAEPARQILDVEMINVVADKGYFKSRTSRLARRRDSRPMSQSHNVEPQWRTAFFARTSFATTPRKTPTFVLAGMN